MRAPHIKHRQIVRIKRLLDMLYKPAEIAEEIGVSPDTVYRSYLPAGCPHTRDDAGNIWIHGPAFADWVRDQSPRHRKRAALPDNHAWCLKCRQPVPLRAPTVKHVNRYLELLQAHCPACGTTIHRARARSRGVTS